jgi:S-adenosylmethionine:tRNA-ribosyltransferase-isomerase (queuine synthetase)
MKIKLLKTCKSVKAVSREKFIALNDYLKKEEIFKINDLRFHPSKLEKEEQINSKVIRRKEIVERRA